MKMLLKPSKTRQIRCKIAIEKNIGMWKYVNNKNKKMCTLYVDRLTCIMLLILQHMEHWEPQYVTNLCSRVFDACGIKKYMNSIDNKRILLKTVKVFPESIKYIKEQTEDLCLLAVGNDGLTLKYVKMQTEQICIAAVRQCGSALKYVKIQTEQICIAAVRQYGIMALKYVKDQTNRICMEAVKNDGSMLKYVDEQTDEMC